MEFFSERNNKEKEDDFQWSHSSYFSKQIGEEEGVHN